MKIPVLLGALLLAACGGAKDDGEVPPAAGVFDDMTGTLDRAADVEQKVMQQKDRIDEALEADEGRTAEQDP